MIEAVEPPGPTHKDFNSFTIDQFRSHMYSITRSETDILWHGFVVEPVDPGLQPSKLTR
jgi:hypothetical protein